MDLSPDRLIIDVAVIAIMLLVAFPVHEFAHAYAAYRLGDSTARLFGRLSLDPIVHFDPVGGTLMAVSVLLGGGIGWAKPTPVNPYNLRGQHGSAIVSAAGPLSNLGLAIIGGVIFRLLDLSGLQGDAVEFIAQVIFLFVLINLGLMVFNLLPIPPLDGSKVLYSLLDPQTERQVRGFLDQYGLIVLLAVVLLPIVNGETILGAIYLNVLEPIAYLLIGR
ncbi:MAG TPA: site-2 protease family protein [Candidatus Limnocylindrales bacterium]|nr:site-2 protease family protein [Candidatus Limnocylindrales bacterium]